MAITSEQTLTSEHRTAFWALADVLIPATDAMPAASQAGSAEKWLERALAARPGTSWRRSPPCSMRPPGAIPKRRRAGCTPRIRDGFSASHPDRVGRLLHEPQDPQADRVSGPRQSARPSRTRPSTTFRDGLLDPVFERGPINVTEPPPPDPVEPAAPLTFSIGGNGAKADIIVHGARRIPSQPGTSRRRGSRSSASSRGAGRTPRRLSGRQARVGARLPTRSGARTPTRGSTRPTTRSNAPSHQSHP